MVYHRFFHWVSTLLMASLITGCGVSIKPLEQPPKLVTAPEYIRIKFDRITNQPVLNLISTAEMDDRAERLLEQALLNYKTMGFQHITAPSDRRLVRLKHIFDRVHNYSHLKDSPIKVVLIENPIFQAYTFGGGAVVFYTGLTEELDDDQLAAVIGHEIAHIAANHIAEETSRSLVNTDTGYWRPHLTGFYALNAEMEADQIGLVYATLAGYAPDASVTFWAEQSDHQGHDMLNPFADSHPTYQDRAKYLQENADKLSRLPRNISEEKRQELMLCNPIYCKQ